MVGDIVITTSSTSIQEKTKLWHMRLGHLSEQGMAELSQRGLLNELNSKTLEFCEHCIYGKHARFNFQSTQHRCSGILDLWGPASIPSHGGVLYMLIFVDDYSRKVWVYFLK